MHDEDIVGLVGSLIDAGIDYWIDKNNIAAGRTDFLEIPKELEPRPASSAAGPRMRKSRHVLDECDFALANDKLIPVLLQPGDVPVHVEPGAGVAARSSRYSG